MSTLQIGKANYNGNHGDKMVFYRLGMKDNQRELTLRIAPPIKDLADRGAFAVYVKQHFGYTVAGKGDKRIPQTFNCLERKDKSKNIIQNCPECDEIFLRKADVASKEARFKADGTAPEVVEAQLRPAKAWIKEHNCDKKWNLLAKNEAGAWGFLALSHTAYTDLQREIKEVQTTMGIEDPLGVEGGVWFRFSRTGSTFNDVNDKVSVLKVALGKGSFGVKQDTLTDKDFQALDGMVPLTTLGRKLSYDQIGMLVQSGGDESVVKSVFASAAPRQETSAVRTGTPSQTVQIANAGSPAAVESVSTVAAPAAVVVPAQAAVDSASLLAQLAAVQAQLAQLRGTPAAAPVAEQRAVQRAVPPTIAKNLDMDADAFIAQFGTPDEE